MNLRDVIRIPAGGPKHPFRITAALVLAGIAGAAGNLVISFVLCAAALKLVWDL